MPKAEPRGHSIHVGVGTSNCLDPLGGSYPFPGSLGDVLRDVACGMADLARSVGYESSSLLLSPNDQRGDQAATKDAFERSVVRIGQDLHAGDHLLITFAGHGERRSQPGSGWVFEDQHLWAADLQTLLRHLPADLRILVISESCNAGGVTTTRAIDDDTTLVVDRSRFKQPVILIGASYDSPELAHVVNDIAVFTDSLLTVWANGAFRGGHRQFVEDIRVTMKIKHDAAGDGLHWQEPRFLASGPDEPSVLEFERMTPFRIGGVPQQIR